MANLTSTTITGNANVTAEVNAATFAGDAGKTSNLAAGNIASGTLSTDRLPTVPTTKGGTGLTSIGSAGQVLKVNAPGAALEYGDAGGGGNLITQVYTGSTTWTKPASVAAVKVTVVGAGGGGGGSKYEREGGSGASGGVSIETIPAASIPGPVSVTVGNAGSGGSGGTNSANPGSSGGTSSFGAFLSATGGSAGGSPPNPSDPGNPGTPGTATGGQINQPGYGRNQQDQAGGFDTWGGWGRGGKEFIVSGNINNGSSGAGYGAGGKEGGWCPSNSQGGNGGSGSAGLVIVEEIY